ncbi:alpha/beta hydrolase [Flavobacterium galactosidilyticum]|uniref:alpha/beta hydrolase n=1 Tax=Flavobacterium galactosidilyticum TaxID=2893886 RepID=UPI001E61DE73|nr:alpha/beta hydrolase [Flavobacterium sp. F-340]UFH46966.1 alpha/beta hydrolase [Flavobacterium sp. F-340]
MVLINASPISAQIRAVPLWETIPGAIPAIDHEEESRVDEQGNRTGIMKVTEPTLKIFLVDNKNTKNAAVIICPGGGYALLSNEKEGDKVAVWLNSIGVSAFVLKYRLPSDMIMEDKTVGPLQDAQEAMRIVRRHADEWNLDATKIGVLGFSAGGHLASTLSTHYNDTVYKTNDNISSRPDFSILIYPVISMDETTTHKVSKENLLGEKPSNELIAKFSNEKQVDSNTPTTFLVHATDDKSVVVENSITYYLALKRHNVPAEMHLYETGGHGFSLGDDGTNQNWPLACEKWMISKKLITTDLVKK